jgi:hypothetical protein
MVVLAKQVHTVDLSKSTGRAASLFRVSHRMGCSHSKLVTKFIQESDVDPQDSMSVCLAPCDDAAATADLSDGLVRRVAGPVQQNTIQVLWA